MNKKLLLGVLLCFSFAVPGAMAFCVWEIASECGYMAIACHNDADRGITFELGNYAYARVSNFKTKQILATDEVTCPTNVACDCYWDPICCGDAPEPPR